LVIPSSSTAGARGGGQGRGGSGSRGRGNRHGSRATTTPRVRSTFKGNTEEINGHVSQCFNECEDKKQFSKTIEALGEYIAKKLKYPGNMASLTKDFVRPEIPKPTELEVSETNRIVIAIWEKKVSAYCPRTDYLDSNLKTAYAVIWGQCSEAMKAKLSSLDDFETKSHKSDCVWILKEIKGITYCFEGQRYTYLSLDNARTSYYAYTQGAEDSISSYLEHFRSLVEVLEHYGGAIGEDPGLLDATAAVSSNTDNATKRLKIARDRTLALAFMKQANRCRFGTLWADLENQFSRGNDQYLIDLTAAYSLLVNFKPPKREEPRRNARSQEAAVEEEDGITFVQSGEVIAGADGVTHTGVTCFRCENKGHYADKCPNGPNATLLQAEAATAVTLLQASHTEAIVADDDNTNHEVSDFTFTQLPSRHELIPSGVLVFKNPNFLTNIRRSNSQLKVHTNGGIKNFGTVWYNPDSLVNIFSLAAVCKLCCITMDTSVEAALCVHRTDGLIMKFIEYRSGLCYHNAAATVQPNSNANVIDYSFVSTVTNNKAQFPRREIEGADKARALYRKIGRPSQQQFERISCQESHPKLPRYR